MKGGGANSCCNHSPKPRTLNSLASILKDFRQNQNKHDELTPFKTYDFPTALRKSALAITHDGKRFNHQRRLTAKSLNAAYAALKKISPQFRRASTFDALHHLLTTHTRPIPGIGELYIYDTTLRLGAHLRLHPTHIYLHAGTRTGARHLNLPTNVPTLPRSAFPKPLNSLSANQLEDLLCIYKHHLARLQL